jgi:transcription antitermination factor NusG
MLEPRLRRWEPKGPVPLFPGYVLAQSILADGYAAAQYCAGSAGLVRLGARFAALEDGDVETLRLHQGERGYVVLPTRRKEVRPGTRVTIVGGSLDGIEGVVSRYLPDRQRVQILLALAWGGCSAEVDARRVRCA